FERQSTAPAFFIFFFFPFFFFFLAGCGTGFSVTEFCFRVCGIFSLEAPDDFLSSVIAFLPVIKLKWHKLCIYSILYNKRNTLQQNVTFINQGCEAGAREGRPCGLQS
ncbi:hypothetical protein Nmel_011475, partial [Mimus melanotis]